VSAANPTVQEILFHEEPRPEVDAVMQRDQDGTCIPVEVTGPVTTHELPSRGATTMIEIAGVQPREILGANRSRKNATLLSTDAPFYVAYSRNPPLNSGPAPVAALWPINVPLVIGHCDWVTIFTLTGTATVSVLTEDWAD